LNSLRVTLSGSFLMASMIWECECEQQEPTACVWKTWPTERTVCYVQCVAQVCDKPGVEMAPAHVPVFVFGRSRDSDPHCTLLTSWQQGCCS
jgi:hypothetical protein